MRRKPSGKRRQEAVRCFAVCAAADKATTACRYKRKAGDSFVAVGQGPYAPATCAGVLTVDKTIKVEVWQTNTFSPATPLDDVVNVPLLPTQLLVFPLILRAQCDSGAAPTVGRLRRLLSEHMKTQTEVYSHAEDEDDAIDSINDTTTIGSVSTEEANNSDSNASDTELESESEDELEHACHGDDDTEDSATDTDEMDEEIEDDEVIAAPFGTVPKRRRVGKALA